MKKHYEIDTTTPLSEEEFRTLLSNIQEGEQLKLRTKYWGRSISDLDNSTTHGIVTVTDKATVAGSMVYGIKYSRGSKTSWSMALKDTYPDTVRAAELAGRKYVPVTEDVTVDGVKIGYWVGDTLYSLLAGNLTVLSKKKYLLAFGTAKTPKSLSVKWGA